MPKTTYPQLITVNGKTYAVGLFWQPLPGGSQKLHFVERTARSLIGGAQLYCTKSGGSPQFGLGFTKKGHKKNLPVATLSVAAALKDKTSMLAVFKVKEGWWMVVQRNNLLLPEDDFLFDNEDEAKKAFKDLLSLPDWGYKIAPASWSIDGTQDMEVGNLLERVRPVTLQPLATKNHMMLIFALIALVVGGYFLKPLLFPKPPTMAEMKKKSKFTPKKLPKKNQMGQAVDAAESTLKAIQHIVSIEKKKMTWEGLLDFKEHAAFCQNGLRYFGQSIPGWALFELSCDDKELRARYERRGGSLDFFETAYQTYFPQAKMETEGRGSTIWLKLDLPKITKRSIKPLLKSKDIEQRLMTFAQRTKQNILLGSAKKTAEQLGDFEVVNFSFSSKIAVGEWASILYTLGPIQWTEMKWNTQTKAWDGKGIIYAKP
ncbi:MAG: type 4b pilus protein PilO2 [Alphaproteobacteria bacterium]|nr:type 4b pilus protein PilO2 [Alphaproteobacteria bacterium]MBN2779573.1 type 4b pilus protein PilO2 [Alphaproteobacteria bacterium]